MYYVEIYRQLTFYQRSKILTFQDLRKYFPLQKQTNKAHPSTLRSNRPKDPSTTPRDVPLRCDSPRLTLRRFSTPSLNPYDCRSLEPIHPYYGDTYQQL